MNEVIISGQKIQFFKFILLEIILYLQIKIYCCLLSNIERKINKKKCD